MSEATKNNVFGSKGLGNHEAYVEELKTKAADLLDHMNSITCPMQGEHQRCFAMARTKLEESVMWHVKGVSRIQK